MTKEDEIRNVQIVIDALASNVLHTSLAHISGRDVVEGNREALLNLLEIFSGLLEYILNKIESDVSTDNDGMCCVCKMGRDVVGEQEDCLNNYWQWHMYMYDLSIGKLVDLAVVYISF